MRNRAALLAASLLAATALGACSTEKTLDTDKAEKEITKGYEQQVKGAKVKGTSCPDDVKAKKGVKATCTLTLTNGNSGKVTVHVLSDDGKIRWDTVEPTD
jgi:ABC-type glycerol-3-phosphate transport system substrate-binding protein